MGLELYFAVPLPPPMVSAPGNRLQSLSFPVMVCADEFTIPSSEDTGAVSWGPVSIVEEGLWLLYHLSCTVNHNREKILLKPTF